MGFFPRNKFQETKWFWSLQDLPAFLGHLRWGRSALASKFNLPSCCF